MVRKLMKCQVMDPQRGSFFPGIKRTKAKFMGLPVYESGEFRFIIMDAE